MGSSSSFLPCYSGQMDYERFENLLRRCLELDPLKRITAREAIDHEFLRSSSRGSSSQAGAPTTGGVAVGIGAQAVVKMTEVETGAAHAHAAAASAPVQNSSEPKTLGSDGSVTALKVEHEESMS